MHLECGIFFYKTLLVCGVTNCYGENKKKQSGKYAINYYRVCKRSSPYVVYLLYGVRVRYELYVPSDHTILMIVYRSALFSENGVQ